jgi:hypothetical protein
MTNLKRNTLGLILAFTATICFAAAGDRFIANPTQDKDVVIQVNKGGTTVEAFKVFGATGVASATIAANIRASEGAGTTTLTIADAPRQIFNLSAARTVVLPTTSVKSGYELVLENRGAFDLTVQASGGNALTIANSANLDATIQKGFVRLVSLQDTPTTPAHWYVAAVEESSSFAVSGGTNSGSGTIKYKRHLGFITLDFSLSHSSAGGTGFSAGAVPTRLRPLGFRNNIYIITGNPQYIDRIEFGNDGSIGATHSLVQSTPGTSSQTTFLGFISYTSI